MLLGCESALVLQKGRLFSKITPSEYFVSSHLNPKYSAAMHADYRYNGRLLSFEMDRVYSDNTGIIPTKHGHTIAQEENKLLTDFGTQQKKSTLNSWLESFAAETTNESIRQPRRKAARIKFQKYFGEVC